MLKICIKYLARNLWFLRKEAEETVVFTTCSSQNEIMVIATAHARTLSLPSCYAVLLLNSNSEFGSLVSHQRSILLMVYEVILRSTHKTDVKGMSNGPRMQQKMRVKKR